MWSRRTFVLAGLGTVAGGRAVFARRELTAQQALDRIRGALGVPWRDGTNDGLKAGDPAVVVTGVTTTAMATLEVLRSSAAAGRNLIVTHEPTFYSANDAAGNRAEDAIYLAKKAFIDEKKLAVIRLAEHWITRAPGAPARALAAELDWAQYRVAGQDLVYKVRATTLATVRGHVEKRLGVTGLRLVGRPDLAVSTILISPGTTDLATVVEHLPSVDLVLAGEPREWEVVPYVLDAIESGQRKGLIAVGRIVSENPSARACAEWLRTVLTGVPVEAVVVKDPLWRAGR